MFQSFSQGLEAGSQKNDPDTPRDGITIMLVPVSQKKTIQFRISFRFLKLIAWITLIFILLVGFSVSLSIIKHKKLSQALIKANRWESIYRIIFDQEKELIESATQLYVKGQELHSLIWGDEMALPHNFSHPEDLSIKSKLLPIQKVLRFLSTREKVLSVMPIGMPLESAYITSNYGSRISPFGEVKEFHTGMDFANAVGYPLTATADGVVFFAGGNSSGYGRHIKILHKHGFMTLYAHCSRINVTTGQQVRRGDVVAYLGESGNTTGPHLHYEIRLYKEGVNPYEIILNPWPFAQETL